MVIDPLEIARHQPSAKLTDPQLDCVAIRLLIVEVHVCAIGSAAQKGKHLTSTTYVGKSALNQNILLSSRDRGPTVNRIHSGVLCIK
jgi:hypothetical protein